jgi:hypothetical protein
LQRPVKTLVEPPGFLHWNPKQVQLFQHDVHRFDGALEHGSVAHVEAEAVLAQQLAGAVGFGHALRGEVHIGPTGEYVG